MQALALYLAIAGLALFFLHRSRYRASRTAALCLILIGALPSAVAGLRGRQMSNLDHYLHWEPWATERAEKGIGITSSGITGDLTTAITPWAAEVRENWRAGVWPLWTSRQFAGTVLLGAAQPAPFFPDQLLALVLPFEGSFAFVYAMRLFVAALGAFLLLRQLGLGDGPGLVAAACWSYSAFHFFWLGWSLGAAAGLLPLLIFAAREVVARADWSGILWGAGALSLEVLAGHPETTLHVVSIVAVVFVAEVVRARRGRRIRPIVAGLAAATLAFLLSAAFVLPVADSVLQSQRWKTQKRAEASKRQYMPVRQSLASSADSFLPFAHGVVGRQEVNGWRPAESFASAYVGSFGLSLACLGLVFSRRRYARGCFAACGLVGILAGANWAPALAVFWRLPGFSVTINSRLILAAALAFSGLAALGFEVIADWSRAVAGDRKALGWLGVRLAGAALLCASTIVAVASPGLRGAGLTWPFLMLQASYYIAPLLLLALIPMLAARKGATFAALLCVTCIVGQRSAEAGHFHAGSTNAGSKLALAPEFLEWLPPDAHGERLVAQGDVLIPNASGLLALNDVRGYDPMRLARYADTFRLWSVQRRNWFNGVEDLERPFLDFLAVRWALVAPPAGVPAGWREVRSERNLQLLRNEEALPLAFVPEQIRTGVESDATLRQMGRAREFTSLAWLEDGESHEKSTRPNAVGRVAIREEAPGRYRLDARFEGEGWIVTSIPAWRGWRARAGAEDLEVATANHAFVAIHAPSGGSTILLEFLPASFLIGARLSALALLLVGLVALLAYRSRRRGGGKPETEEGLQRLSSPALGA